MYIRAYLKQICLALAVLLVVPILLAQPEPARAAASLYVSGPASVNIGDMVTLTIGVDTGGVSGNAFEGTLSYSTGMFTGVRGSYSGSICTLPITQPDPSGGSATFSCGTPSGYTGSGTVATVVLTATATGSSSFGLSGCSVLANDGRGTDITGGCSGRSITVNALPTPVPTPVATPIPAPTASTSSCSSSGSSSTTTTKATATPAAGTLVKPTQSAKPAETPKTATPTPATSTPPPVQALPSDTPTPAASTTTSTDTSSTTTTSSSAPATSSSPAPKRTVATAFQDLFASIKSFNLKDKDISGLIALLLSLIPFLALLLAITYLFYRTFVFGKRRKRSLDRLFEMQLTELAALEGKMDLLAEKGTKGREQYREEFKKAKENILRELRPDYNKPLESIPKVAPASSEAPAADKPASEAK